VPKPKGGEERAFELPLSNASCELIMRVLRSHNSEWLWPSSKSKSGHHSKSGHIERIEPRPEDGFSVKWRPHDLWRMWASAAAAVVTNGYHLKALRNHALPKADVTGAISRWNRRTSDLPSKRLRIGCGLGGCGSELPVGHAGRGSGTLQRGCAGAEGLKLLPATGLAGL